MRRPSWIPQRRALLAALVLLASARAGASENFRVHKTILLTLPQSGESEAVSANCNDAVAIILPEDRTFIQGVEIYVKVPQVVSEWHDSVAWFIYSGITPRPTEKRIDYKGEREHTGTFGVSLRKTVQIPLAEPNTIKRDAYSEYVAFVPSEDEPQVFFRMQLAMKGASSGITSAKFEITAKPILIDKGLLSLETSAPDGTESAPFTAFLDGRQTELSGPLLLDTGVHTLSLVSDAYRNEVRTFTVSQAQTTELSVTFRDITPLLLIAAPDNAAVYVDGQELREPKEPVPVQQGDHTVRFVMGGYEVTKQVSAVNGRSYTVALSMDATITESE